MTAPPAGVDGHGADAGGLTDDAGPTGEIESAAEEHIVFELADHPFAVPLTEVDEIIRVPRLTPLPLAPPAVLGIMNLRGRTIPVADLRRCCGLAAADADEQARVLVTGTEAVIGFVVDRVVGIHDERAQSLDASVVAGSDVGAGLIRGVLHGPDGLIGVLDLGAVVDREFRHDGPARTAAGHRGGEQTAPSPTGDTPDDVALELVSFMAAGQEFALPLADVREILQAPEAPTPVPRARGDVVGLTDLRGRILPLFSLRGLLGLPEDDGAGRRVVVVGLNSLGRPGATVGLVADGVREVLAAGSTSLRSLPPAMSERSGVSRVCVLDEGNRMVSVLSVDALFEHLVGALDEQLAGEAANEETAENGVGMTVEEIGANELQMVIFRLDDEEFAMAVEDVSEIVRHPDTTARVPDAPPFVAGLCSLRGEVLTLVDLRVRVGAPTAPLGEATRIVVTAGEHRVGLVVDAVIDVRRVSADSVLPPDGIAAGRAAFVSGVVTDPTGDALALLVDPSLLLAGTGLGAEPVETS